MPLITSVSAGAIPPWLDEAYRKLAERSITLAQEKYIPYERQRLAEFPPEILRAQQMGRQTETYLPTLREAFHSTKEAQRLFPEDYRYYMNPYQEHVLSNLESRAKRALVEQFLPAIESRFIAAGQHGGRRQQEMALRAARDVQEALLAEQRQALSSGYEQAARIHQADKARQLAGSESLMNLGRQEQAGRLADIATLQELGQQQQQHHQQGLNIGYQDFLRQTYHPQEQLAQHAAVLGGLPSPTQQFSAQYHPGPATTQVNPLGQVGALATTLYGAKKGFGFKRGGYTSKFKRRY